MNQHSNKKPPKQKQPKKKVSKSFSETYRELSPYLNMGYTLAASIVLFTFLGSFLDDYWKINPWGTLAGSLTGIAVGFYHFFKVALAKKEKDKKET